RKMSKSLGNIIPLRDAIREYGADALRIAVVSTAELLQDANFSPALARAVKGFLEKLLSQYRTVSSMQDGKPSWDRAERWLMSRLQRIIEETTEALETLNIRKAAQFVLYQMDNDLNWFLRRKGYQSLKEASESSEILKRFMETRARLLTPLAPYTAEEVWSILGMPGLVCEASWPKPDSSLVDEEAEMGEEFLKALVDDTKNVLRVVPGEPSRIIYYVASPWKWRVYELILASDKPTLRDVMTRLKKLTVDRSAMARFAKSLISSLPRMDRASTQFWIKLGPDHEFKLLNEAKRFLSEVFKAEILVYNEEDSNIYDPKGRARLSKPGRPAIYVEVETQRSSPCFTA
ncbi:TPA: hypothetical protein EYP27_01695, partial [Candidatus Bathyarchaeota archaeon]|nr:hypothetical protein [Candidatus Bathyarchaeota archaeon]